MVRIASSIRRLAALRLHSIRKRELNKVLARLSLGPNDRTLEIGSADGAQSKLLAAHSNCVFSTDIYADPSAPSPRFHVSVPEHLPIRSGSMDHVFTSCVMEHVNDRERVVGEIHRVLKSGGHMIHIVPGPAWKALSLVEHYAYLPVYLINVLATRGGQVIHPLARHESQSTWSTLRKYLTPQVHGNFADHRHEWMSYQVESWSALFSRHGFSLELILPLYIYAYLTVPLIPAPESLGKKGLSGTIAFVCRKS